MQYPYKVYPIRASSDENHIMWIAESEVFLGCVGYGNSSEEAVNEMHKSEREILERLDEHGKPRPKYDPEYRPTCTCN